MSKILEMISNDIIQKQIYIFIIHLHVFGVSLTDSEVNSSSVGADEKLQ